MASHKEGIESQLDQVLLDYAAAKVTERESERKLDSDRRRTSELDEDARRLRLAIFALDGKSFVPGIVGDANSANHSRLMELQRADEREA
jgi:hypothetical protein